MTPAERAAELEPTLSPMQREFILEHGILVDPFGFEREPSEIGLEVMRLVREKAAP